MSNLNGKTPSPKELLQSIIDRKDKDALHAWLEVYFHTYIPRKSICPDHDAPFDFVSDYIFGIYDFMVVLANRSGGKTFDFGILDTTMSFLQDNTEIATVGAIQFQAQKGYEYFKAFSMEYPFAPNIISRTMGKTLTKNGSAVQILTGTYTGVNSPHPQLVFLDEIDLMAWQVVQQALSMAQSKDDVKSRTVLTSTRKFANGAMQRMITEAPEKDYKVYTWCVWEVVKPMPEDKALRKQILETFGTALPARIKDAEGYYFWEDLIRKYKTLDTEVWETEWICKRPGLEGVIYGSSYSDENNLIINTPDLGAGYIYIFEDYGYGEGHPDVVLFVWIPRTFDRMVVFDELYMTGMGTEDIWEETKKMAKTYGIELPDREAGIGGTIQGWAGDPHGLTETEDRRFRGAPMMEKNDDAKLYELKNGIPLVRKFFQSGRLMITGKCTELRTELMSYKKHKNRDGSYSKDPEKKYDHGPDALRYGVLVLKEQIWENAFGVDEPEKKVKPLTLDEIKREDRKTGRMRIPEDSTITGDLVGRKW